ncbi:MAG: hypothetical protein FJW40_00490 [Acidobacteria bacterium]|nr:hypothetical protein [Acidobacteriota bacterium]
MTNTISAAAAPPDWLSQHQRVTRGEQVNPPELAARAEGGDGAQSKEMFLKLLVAQIQNQNPLTPADPIQFVSQLTQFSGVEQMLEMRKSLASIEKSLGGQQPAAPAPRPGA